MVYCSTAIKQQLLLTVVEARVELKAFGFERVCAATNDIVLLEYEHALANP